MFMVHSAQSRDQACSAMKENSDPIQNEVAIALGIGLEELHPAVGAFGGRVRDAVLCVGEQPRQMTLEGSGSFDDRG